MFCDVDEFSLEPVFIEPIVFVHAGASPTSTGKISFYYNLDNLGNIEENRKHRRPDLSKPSGVQNLVPGSTYRGRCGPRAGKPEKNSRRDVPWGCSTTRLFRSCVY